MISAISAEGVSGTDELGSEEFRVAFPDGTTKKVRSPLFSATTHSSTLVAAGILLGAAQEWFDVASSL